MLAVAQGGRPHWWPRRDSPAPSNWVTSPKSAFGLYAEHVDQGSELPRRSQAVRGCAKHQKISLRRNTRNVKNTVPSVSTSSSTFPFWLPALHHSTRSGAPSPVHVSWTTLGSIDVKTGVITECWPGKRRFFTSLDAVIENGSVGGGRCV